MMEHITLFYYHIILDVADFLFAAVRLYCHLKTQHSVVNSANVVVLR